MATNTLSLLSRSSHNARWPFSPRTDVGFSEHTSRQALTGSWIVGIDGSILSPSQFQLVSGPCTLSNDGKCVGRPQGYTEGESCIIIVATGGALAACPMFQVRPQPSSFFIFSFKMCDHLSRRRWTILLSMATQTALVVIQRGATRSQCSD
jgi:hypothetical protein